MTQKILVPLDGSQFAEQALSIANDLALWEDIELIMLRVVEDDVLPIPAYMGGLDVHVNQSDSAKVSQSNLYMDKMTSREMGKINTVTSLVMRGKPAESILKVAEDEGVDLIIMATHGYGFWERIILGSVTEQVVRRAPCPVFSVRDGHIPEHFLIALDGTEYAEQVLPIAFKLASLFDARVSLTIVRSPEDMPLLKEMSTITQLDKQDVATMVAIESGRAAHYLEKIRAHYLAQYDLEISYWDHVGNPGREIVREAERIGCDVIAMVTHGRAGLDWLMNGSVTNSVMRNTDAAMLILHKE